MNMPSINRPCPICAGLAATPFLTSSGYSIIQCATCRFLFVDPAPTPAALQAFYQRSEYFSGSELGYGNYLGQRLQHEQLARGRLIRIEQILPMRRTLLDVGCAAGFFLEVAKQRGWVVSGVEIAETMAAHARELTGQPIVATLEELHAAPESFDVISAWEYIEHMAEPGAEIRRLAALLCPGGVLAFSTPNTGYWTALHRPHEWREFKPPAHLGFFTAATLRRAIESAGLQVIALPKVVAIAPTQPALLNAMLNRLRHFGTGAERRTRLWWVFGLAWRLVERLSQVIYRLRWPGSDLHIGLEIYARKP